MYIPQKAKPTIYEKAKKSGAKARDFYQVSCPFCGAAPGESCFQLSIFKKTGERRYFSPHSARVRARVEELK